MAYIEVNDLQKRFKKLEAVRGVSFAIQKGEIYGLLGPNGAGKSTTISMLAGLVKPSGGDMAVAGFSVAGQPLEAKRRIGLVPQDIALYSKLSARDNLKFWGRMYGIPGKTLAQRIKEVLELTGLTQRADEPLKNYSGGMKRRINIAAGILHQPELLILDEPTVGVDPQSRTHIFDLIRGLNQNGTTVIYTSHYMEEVELLCDRVTIMDQGRIVASGTKEQLLQQVGEKQEIAITVPFTNESFYERLRTIPHVHQVKATEEQVKILTDQAESILTDVLGYIITARITVSKIEIKKPNLETLFMKITGRSLRD